MGPLSGALLSAQRHRGELIYLCLQLNMQSMVVKVVPSLSLILRKRGTGRKAMENLRRRKPGMSRDEGCLPVTNKDRS